MAEREARLTIRARSNVLKHGGSSNDDGTLLDALRSGLGLK